MGIWPCVRNQQEEASSTKGLEANVLLNYTIFTLDI